LARDLPAQVLESMTQEVQLDQAVDQAAQLMAGKVHGRVVVKVQ
jgi:acrylyl-CoA reductase (NADPH)